MVASYLAMVATVTSFEGSVFIDEGINRNGTLCIGQDQDLKNFQPPTTEPKDLVWHFKYQHVDNNINAPKGGLSVISISNSALKFLNAKKNKNHCRWSVGYF